MYNLLIDFMKNKITCVRELIRYEANANYFIYAINFMVSQKNYLNERINTANR